MTTSKWEANNKYEKKVSLVFITEVNSFSIDAVVIKNMLLACAGRFNQFIRMITNIKLILKYSHDDHDHHHPDHK